MPEVSPLPGLRPLQALIGIWDLVASAGDQELGRGRAVFEWLGGGAFLVRREEMEPAATLPAEMVAASPYPTLTIVGADESTEDFGVLYADARGVSRTMLMSLKDGVWRMWRDQPGFRQRFDGRFSRDGRAIAGRWEKSEDGVTWQTDFDLRYVRTTDAGIRRRG